MWIHMSNGKTTLKKLSSLIRWYLIGTNFQHSYVLDEFRSWKKTLLGNPIICHTKQIHHFTVAFT